MNPWVDFVIANIASAQSCQPLTPLFKCDIKQGCISVGCMRGRGRAWRGGHARHARPLWKEWQMRLKTLPCRKLRLRAVTRKHSSRMLTARLPTVGNSVATSRCPHWCVWEGVGYSSSGVGHTYPLPPRDIYPMWTDKTPVKTLRSRN